MLKAALNYMAIWAAVAVSLASIASCTRLTCSGAATCEVMQGHSGDPVETPVRDAVKDAVKDSVKDKKQPQ